MQLLRTRSASKPRSKTLRGELTYIRVCDAVETGAPAGNLRTNRSTGREAPSALNQGACADIQADLVILGERARNRCRWIYWWVSFAFIYAVDIIVDGTRRGFKF